MTWADWGRHHAATFGMVERRDEEMLRGWFSLFAAEGYTPEELRGATDWVAMHNPPEYRTQHLTRLVERLRSQRARPASAPDQSDCSLCGGVGVLCGMPLPDDARCKGRWVTVAVTCKCPLGLYQAQNGWRRLHTLRQYEAIVPDWRERVRVRAEAARLRPRAEQEAGDLDRELGKVMRRARGAAHAG